MMPVDPDADVEIVALNWVPDFAKGYVRDFRVRWALEEANLPYRTRLYHPMKKPTSYFDEQPFGQVPAFRDGDVSMFESGAIVMHIAEAHEQLMPRDANGRARTFSWAFAAMNSVEPMLFEFGNVNFFAKGEQWAELRRPSLMEWIHKRLGLLANALGDRQYLDGRFTAGDLLMASALRALEGTDVLDQHPRLAEYQSRCLARPAYRAAIDAQMADFKQNEPV